MDSTRAYADLVTRLQAEGLLPSFRNGGNILDCSIGTIALGLALTNVRVQINGMDITPFRHHSLRVSPRQIGVNVQVYHGDIYRLPFATASFHMVVGARRLTHMADPRQGLQELMRVLCAGAPLIVIVGLEVDHSPAEIASEYILDTMQYIGLRNVHACNLVEHSSSARYDIACVGFKAAC